MVQKFSFLLSKSRRRLLSVILEMLRGRYSVADVESVLRAAKERKLKGSQIRALDQESRERKRLLKKEKAAAAAAKGAAPEVPEIFRVLDEEFGHARTRAEHACLDKDGRPLPWYTYAAIGYAGQLDFSGSSVFEYGSGYSTLFWAGRARRVVAVEHEPEWHDRMSPMLPGNAEYRLVTDADAYAKTILEYPGLFDVVIIDGEHRPACTGPALEKLHPDGLIIVDNADWFPGICASLRAAGLLQVDFQGLGPINSYAWTTSFFFRRSACFGPRAARQPVHGPGSCPNLCDLPVDPAREKPALNELDDKLAKYLDFRGGFFIEAGANDGFNQSNTYHLENSLGWRGLLVEGIPALAETCRLVRARSTVCHAALVADEMATPSVTMRYANLMSLVDSSLGGADGNDEHIRQGVEIQQLEGSYSVEVKARTLSSLLNEKAPGQKIDFLSLDVEGFEIEVLKGLDLGRHQPDYLLVETWKFDEVNALVGTHYELIEKLTVHDYLFRVRGWKVAGEAASV